jgi:hypothetical protein
MSHFRSALCRVRRPPLEHASLSVEALTLRMFNEAFHDKAAANPLACFQNHFQAALF